jgi:hypothetical protein
MLMVGQCFIFTIYLMKVGVANKGRALITGLEHFGHRHNINGAVVVHDLN